MRRITMTLGSAALVLGFGFNALGQDKAPAQVPMQAPAKAPMQAPAQAPAKAPLQAPAQAPAKAPMQAPAKVSPVQVPAQAPAKSPMQSPAQSPVQAGKGKSALNQTVEAVPQYAMSRPGLWRHR